jgi:aryl-alcohol dehydrogenase-like predicted oxidoreductase
VLSGKYIPGSAGASSEPARLHTVNQARLSPRNLAIADALGRVAAGIGKSPAQVALAWVLAKGGDIVPIPGTKRRTYLEENARAVDLSLSADEVARLDRLFARGAAAGDRYPAAQMKRVGL